MKIIRPILVGHFEAYGDKSKSGFNPKSAVSIFKPTEIDDHDDDVSVTQQYSPPPSRHAIYSVDIQPNTRRHHEKISHDDYTRLATCGGGSKIDQLIAIQTSY